MPVFLQPLTLDTANATALARSLPAMSVEQITSHLIQTSPFAMHLDNGDIHALSVDGSRCALDLDVAATIWGAIRRIARTILTAANPGMDVHRMIPFIPAPLLTEIDMPAPYIIEAFGYSQNPCIISGTPEQIIARFRYVQQLGVDGLRWLIHAKHRCAVLGSTRWRWPSGAAQTFGQHAVLDQGPIEALEDRSLDHFERPEDRGLAMILHPVLSNAATAAGTNALVHVPRREARLIDDESASASSAYSPFYSPSACFATQGSASPWAAGSAASMSPITPGTPCAGGGGPVWVGQDSCPQCTDHSDHGYECHTPGSDYYSDYAGDDKTIGLMALDHITRVDSEGRLFIDLTGEEDD